MKLSELLNGVSIKEVVGNGEVEIADLKLKSNQVLHGSLFFCIKGKDYDGHDFIRDVENYGGVAVVCSKKTNTRLTQIVVENVRIAMSQIAGNFYKNPQKSLKLIGVTGTNGKTTTTYMIKRILDENGKKCGLIGTLGAYYNGEFIEQSLTTPDPIELYKTFRKMVDNGIKYCVMEVSAHALALDKLYGLKFEVGVFTNLTQDHLDFFDDMDNYESTKRTFFEGETCRYKVVNSDDKLGKKIIGNCQGVISYGIYNPADTFAIRVEENRSGSAFIINLFDCVYNVSLKLLGQFNVYNAMGALTTCCLLGVKPQKAVESIENVDKVEGRLEKIYDGDFSVFVDYAHTPDGLEKSLTSLKKICKNRLICVFGCGGNRDREKRKIMGEISGNNADFTVITTDNSRYEEPMDIMLEIEKGLVQSRGKYVIVQNRKEGISYAIDYAKTNDVILVAGKGGERYQEILGIKHPYSDKETIMEILYGE